MFKLEKIVRPSILSFQPYSSARDEYSGVSGVFLDANENPFGELNRYPDPYQKELKQKLSELKKIKSENIFIGNGSDEIIDLAFRIFCNPSVDKALTFSPTYGMYNISANINNVDLIKIPMTKDFQIDLNITDNYLSDSKLKLIFICSPNNPSGNLIAKKDIEFILKKFDRIVIIDEAYIDFSDSKSWITAMAEYPNLIVCQTFSKAWGLAGVRVGVAYSNEDIIKLFSKVKPPYNVSELNQKAVINALSDYAKFKENLQVIKQEKQKLEVEISKINHVLKVYPSDANFLLIEVTDTNKIYNKLVSKKIIVRNRNNIIDNCIRISIGTPEENKQLISELKNI